MSHKGNGHLISIAMATYNGEKYLTEQLDSIYAQTYKNIEVIVCDDCSSDKTVEILEDYSKKFGLKYFVNENNLGFVKNFEKAVNLCRGDYIALSDQDDIWLPHKLSTLMENIGDNILTCSDLTLINESGHIIEESFFESTNRSKNEKFTFYKLMFRNYIWGCTILMKKDLLKKAHPIPINAESHDQWYGLVASTAGSIYLCKWPLVLYRQHDKNQFGAKKFFKISILKKFFLSMNKEHYKKRIYEGQQKAKVLKSYKESNIFSESENQLLEDLILFYQSWGSGFIHFKAFFMALKYKDDMYYNVPKYLRIFACLRSLFI
ncbi:MAG: hypothetical protein QG564_948 [Campylobacterota bacterium]|nr:hypothetical protein [Campylobacterota bacterium]